MGQVLFVKYFFERFEFDAASGELSGDGYTQRLPEQNARLLKLLLQQAGSVIDRNELRAYLWPSGEHLNYDHAISNSINQLRTALQDNPRAPAFIETLPKRGYRFIAEVRCEAEGTETVEPPEEQPSATELEEASSGTRSMRRYVWAACGLCLLLALAAAGVVHLRQRTRPAASTPDDVSLAILPIEATGTLAQKVAEPFRLELTDTASQLPGVEVRAANSVGTAPTAPEHLRELAAQLNVQLLLVGRMISTGQDLDLSFELVRASDTVHLTSFHYTGTLDTLGNIRSDMERDLFRSLSDTRHNRLNPLHSTNNTQAYNDYLTGRAYLMEHTDEAIVQAMVAFRSAIEKDGQFAQPYAGLSNAAMLLAEHSAVHKEENYRISREAAQKSIALNPRVAEAHATLGFLLFRHDWNAAEAEPEIQRAIALEPGQAMHRVKYALLLGNSGRLPQALQQIDRARAIDPLWPPVFITEAYLAAAAGDNQRALAACDTLLKLKPGWSLAHDQYAWALWYAGQHQRAVEAWLRMAQLEHDDARVEIEQKGLDILKRSGLRAYSEWKLQAAMSNIVWRHANDFQPAEWQLNAGQPDKALVSLQAMVAAHDPDSLQIGVSPAYFALHNDPRFQDILRKIRPGADH